MICVTLVQRLKNSVGNVSGSVMHPVFYHSPSLGSRPTRTDPTVGRPGGCPLNHHSPKVGGGSWLQEVLCLETRNFFPLDSRPDCIALHFRGGMIYVLSVFCVE